MESYRKALERKPDFYASWKKLGHMHLFKREYARAESCYKQLTASGQKDVRSEGRIYLAYIPAYQGKLQEALKLLDDGLAADRMEQAEGRSKAWKHSLKGLIYLEKRSGDLASQEAEKAVEIWRQAYPDDRIWGRHHYVQVLTELNEIEKAEQVAQALKNDIKEDEENRMRAYLYALGCIDLAKGNFHASIENLERAVEGLHAFFGCLMLARAYLESDKLDKAVEQLEKMLSRYDEDRAGTMVWAVKAYYLLGLAYEKSGWNSKAIEQYEEFLRIWKDADAGIAEVEDAKHRLGQLKSKA